jgi:radical SAM protein with 4Fe4S-binding SPASM domain
VSKYGKLKLIAFTGLGEPLINTELPQIISYAKKISAADKTVIITNGSLLTPELSDQLIDAGLDEMRVSMQGLNSAQYYETAGINIDFSELVAQIRYFYEHKKNCRLYVKIMDVMINNGDDEKRYYEMFSSISDETAIENLIPINAIDSRGASDFSLKSGRAIESKSCPLPFYQPLLRENGDIYSCCNIQKGGWAGVKIGNLINDEFGNIWNSGRHKQLCEDLLNGKREHIPECSECFNYKYQGSSKDFLDGHEQEILARLNKGEYSHG